MLIKIKLISKTFWIIITILNIQKLKRIHHYILLMLIKINYQKYRFKMDINRILAIIKLKYPKLFIFKNINGLQL